MRGIFWNFDIPPLGFNGEEKIAFDFLEKEKLRKKEIRLQLWK
jgi:hypothetical protein